METMSRAICAARPKIITSESGSNYSREDEVLIADTFGSEGSVEIRTDMDSSMNAGAPESALVTQVSEMHIIEEERQPEQHHHEKNLQAQRIDRLKDYISLFKLTPEKAQ